MSRDRSDNNPRVLNEEEVRRVLKRAAEIESSRQGFITDDLLVEIAQEAGIGADAVKRALEETRSEVMPRRSWGEALLSAGPGKVFAAAMALGVLQRSLRGMFDGSVHWEALASLVVACGYLAAAAWSPDRDRPYAKFQMKGAATWLGFAAGWSLIHGSVWGDLVGVTVGYSIGTAAIGSVVVWLRRAKWPPSSADATTPGGSKRGVWQRFVERIRGDSDRNSPIKFTDLQLGMGQSTAHGTKALV